MHSITSCSLRTTMETKLFEDIVHLLQGVDWLYNYPMTQVFTRDMFRHMPAEWQTALQGLPLHALNGLPQCLALEPWPSSLKVFLGKCQRLSRLSQDFTRDSLTSEGSSSSHPQIPLELTLGLSAKKKHEITTLLSVVKKMLDDTGSKHVLDIGSGKGYIDSCIHRILHAQVLGVEGNCKLMRSAEKHHWKLYGRCKGITFLNWHLSDNMEALCRASQLVSYLTELDTSCSCQTSTRGRNVSAKGASRTYSSSNTAGKEGPVVDGDSVSPDTECRDTTHSLSVSDDSVADDDVRPEGTCTLLGLHACADLSPIIIKLFRDCVQASSLVLLSCCYHKMSLHPKSADKPVSEEQDSPPLDSDESEIHAECPNEGDLPQNEEESICEGNDFLNFPMSQALQEVFRQNNFHMSVFGLRLGAQMSGQNWCTESPEDHEYHMRNVAYRGILEAACVAEGLTVQKLRRRCVRKSGFRDFSEYKKNVFENYQFLNTESVDTPIESASQGGSTQSNDQGETVTTNSPISATLDSCHEKYQHYFPLIEPLTGLQLALQPVIEVMVQVDRLTYLKECGFSKVWLEKVFDVEISPRNVALLAVR
ncbi:Protein RRNAD1 [Chionoecetes opilio]|uniref:Protein RRNAD1 n=1 Tax=Chionoecetes opilio TaxID=41210 RepID=A0A8J4YD88_CHIOP|nr:Protein RRNAD1 [Chionoecetes opilio]